MCARERTVDSLFTLLFLSVFFLFFFFFFKKKRERRNEILLKNEFQFPMAVLLLAALSSLL